jgi:thymidylate synthase
MTKLLLNPKIKNINSFTFEDIKLENYQHHPAIKGKVAV